MVYRQWLQLASGRTIWPSVRDLSIASSLFVHCKLDVNGSMYYAKSCVKLEAYHCRYNSRVVAPRDSPWRTDKLALRALSTWATLAHLNNGGISRDFHRCSDSELLLCHTQRCPPHCLLLCSVHRLLQHLRTDRRHTAHCQRPPYPKRCLRLAH